MTITELLVKHEGLKLQVYDDATGKALKPGMMIVGWPTIGVGRNCTNPGVSHKEALLLLDNDIIERQAGLRNALPWWDTLSEVRQAVLISMSFMGLAKLLKFKRMLGYLGQGNYEQAAVQMLASKWASQVKGRSVTLAQMMRSDAFPS